MPRDVLISLSHCGRINSTLLALSCSNGALVHCFNALNFHRSSFEFNLSVPDFPPVRRLRLFFFLLNFHVSVENFRLFSGPALKTLWAKTTLKLNFPRKHVCALVRNRRLRNHLAQRETLTCGCCLPHLHKHFAAPVTDHCSVT